MITTQEKTNHHKSKQKTTDELLKELRAYNKYWDKAEKQHRIDNSTPDYFKIKRVSI